MATGKKRFLTGLMAATLAVSLSLNIDNAVRSPRTVGAPGLTVAQVDSVLLARGAMFLAQVEAGLPAPPEALLASLLAPEAPDSSHLAALQRQEELLEAVRRELAQVEAEEAAAAQDRARLTLQVEALLARPVPQPVAYVLVEGDSSLVPADSTRYRWVWELHKGKLFPTKKRR